MTKNRVLLAAAVVLVVLAGAAGPGSAAPALSYRCASSTRTVDDRGYSGPAPDNWKIKVSVCAARSGTSVTVYAEIRWDGPAFYAATDARIFDGAKLRLQVRESRPGADPVVVERDFDVRERLERATPGGDRDGVYRTPVVSHRAGPAYADAVLLLDWHRDGRGHGRHDVKESPTV